MQHFFCCCRWPTPLKEPAAPCSRTRHIAAAVLVLDLREGDGAAAVGEEVAHRLRRVREKSAHLRFPGRRRRAVDEAWDVRQPQGKSTHVPFRANVGAKAEVYEEAVLLSLDEKGGEVVIVSEGSREIPVARLVLHVRVRSHEAQHQMKTAVTCAHLVSVPEHVGLNCSHGNTWDAATLVSLSKTSLLTHRVPVSNRLCEKVVPLRLCCARVVHAK